MWKARGLDNHAVHTTTPLVGHTKDFVGLRDLVGHTTASMQPFCKQTHLGSKLHTRYRIISKPGHN